MHLQTTGTPGSGNQPPADPWSVPAQPSGPDGPPAWPAAVGGTPVGAAPQGQPAYSGVDSWSGAAVRPRMHPALAATLGAVGGIVGAVALGALAGFGLGGGDLYLAETYGPGGDHPKFALQQGTCAPAELEDVATGSAAECGKGGVTEAYLRVRSPLGSGVDYDRMSLDAYGDSLCYMDFRTATSESYESSDLEYVALVPSRRAWRDGARDVVCVLLPE